MKLWSLVVIWITWEFSKLVPPVNYPDFRWFSLRCVIIACVLGLLQHGVPRVVRKCHKALLRVGAPMEGVWMTLPDWSPCANPEKVSDLWNTLGQLPCRGSSETGIKKTKILNSIKHSVGCASCGCRQVGELTWHHTQTSTKRITVPRLVSQHRGGRRIQQELHKCIVLCVKCHREVHDEK